MQHGSMIRELVARRVVILALLVFAAPVCSGSFEEYLTWPPGMPQAAVLDLKHGSSREEVLVALGKPTETLDTPRNMLRYRVKAACLPDLRQRVATGVLHYQDRLKFPVKLHGKKHKMQQDLLVYFNPEGRYCAAAVFRTVLDVEENSYPHRYYLKILSNVLMDDPARAAYYGRLDWDEYGSP